MSKKIGSFVGLNLLFLFSLGLPCSCFWVLIAQMEQQIYFLQQIYVLQKYLPSFKS